MSDTPRLKPRDLRAKQVEPLEQRMPTTWPDSWKEIALSFFVTLLSLPNWREMNAEALAMDAATGVAEDMGGTQPYIPVGANPRNEKNRETVSQMLRDGHGYRDVAKAVGLTEGRIRKIEAEERKARQAGNSKAR